MNDDDDALKMGTALATVGNTYVTSTLHLGGRGSWYAKANVVRGFSVFYTVHHDQYQIMTGGGGPKHPKILQISFMYGPHADRRTRHKIHEVAASGRQEHLQCRSKSNLYESFGNQP